nr:succinate dehydrogenase, cytochrome b556 subunit [Candidatus Liberibacter solanacearum]
MSDLKSNRPLSPHLQIYKLIPTMLISIVHRITGSAVYFGTPALVLWFFAVSEGKYTLGLWRSYTDCGFFSIFLFLYTWSAIHHMLGGIRYLMWDSSFLLEKKSFRYNGKDQYYCFNFHSVGNMDSEKYLLMEK